LKQETIRQMSKYNYNQKMEVVSETGGIMEVLDFRSCKWMVFITPSRVVPDEQLGLPLQYTASYY